MSNPLNNGTLTGRLGADPVVFDNKDGSKTVKYKLYVDRNYKSADGKRGSDGIPLEAYVSATTDFARTPYPKMHKGDLVSVATSVRTDVYAKNGETVYATKIISEGVQFLESKTATEARLAERVKDLQEAVQQTAPAPAWAQNQPQPQAQAQAQPQMAMAGPVLDEQMPFNS